MQNILLINVNWLGDVVFSAPVFKAIKEKYPQSKVSCLAVPRVKEILECIEGVDEIIVYDEDGKHKFVSGKIGLIFELRKRKFDVAFLLHRSLTRALLIWLAGIKQRVGYETKGRGRLLTHPLTEPKDKIHRSDYYLRVIEGFDIPIMDRTCQLKVDPKAQTSVDLLMKNLALSNQEFVVIHPGGNWDLKRWPAENFSLMIKKLMEEKKWKIVITGSSIDLTLVKEIVKCLPIKPIILTGKLTLKELMALMQKAKFVISNDSGPIHLASGVGTSVIGLFGPTRPELTGPRGVGFASILQKDVGCNREACYHLKCPSNVCMQAITVKDVYETVK